MIEIIAANALLKGIIKIDHRARRREIIREIERRQLRQTLERVRQISGKEEEDV